MFVFFLLILKHLPGISTGLAIIALLCALVFSFALDEDDEPARMVVATVSITFMALAGITMLLSYSIGGL